MSICRVEKVFKEYYTGKITATALKDINLKIDAGEFAVLAGPSGSGKTTLLNLLGCLDKPTSGNIYLDQQQLNLINSFTAANIRNKYLGFIFQAYNLIPTLSAYENIELPLLLLGNLERVQRKEKVEKALQDVGLHGLGSRKPKEMSGGQQQRVAIARALIKEPLLVLADEPTANLDSKTGQEILGLMQKLNREKGTTFIFSSHDSMVIEYSRRVISLHDGQIIKDQQK